MSSVVNSAAKSHTQFLTGSTEHLNLILEEIKNGFSPNSENVTGEQYRSLFDSLISVLSSKDNFEDFYTSSTCIYILELLVSQKPQIFTNQDCELVIKTVVNVMENFNFDPEEKIEKSTVYKLHLSGWSILSSDIISEIPLEWTDKLCEMIKQLFKTFYKLESELFQKVLTFLKTSLRKTSVPVEPPRDRSTTSSIIFLIGIRIHTLSEKDHHLLQNLMSVLHALLEYHGRFYTLSRYTQRDYVVQSFKTIKRLNDSSIQNLILDSVSDALELLPQTVYEMFFAGELKQTTLRLLNTKATHESCITFLVTLYQLQKYNTADLSQHNRLVDKILDIVSDFEFSKEGSDSYESIRYIDEKAKWREVLEWAYWAERVFGIDENKEEGEPMSKKMRVC